MSISDVDRRDRSYSKQNPCIDSVEKKIISKVKIRSFETQSKAGLL